LKIIKTCFSGLFIIDNFHSTDKRGVFCKTFNKKAFLDFNIDFTIDESFYSVSNKNVVRGMHFQLPNSDHHKLVCVPAGKILDVVVDLRKSSETYKNFFSIELSAENRKSLWIPKGFAHGFKSLEDNTITIYNVSTVYNPDLDTGIRYDSFGFDWGNDIADISDRDLGLKSLEEYSINNPF